MAWSATAEPQRFTEAVEWFEDRLPLTPELADTLADYSGDRAWTVAGLTQLDVVFDVWRSLLDAVEHGTPFAEWQKNVEPRLTKAWGRRNAPRVETVFRNATQQAFNAGRWRQITDPAVKAFRPFILVDGIDDARQSAICNAIDGTIVSVDDPWLDTHSPQLHHRCRTQLRTLSAADAKRRGGATQQLPADKADEGFGRKPTATAFEPDATKYPAPLFDIYLQKRAELEQRAKRSKPKPRKKAA